MATDLVDNTFKYIFMNEQFGILIRIPMKFVPKLPIYNKSALVQVMAWHQTGTSHYLNHC